MPARLLIVADARMLPALATGLREGGRFEVTTASFADPAAVASAAPEADALALFYGAPDKPLPAALQALAPAARGRGARVVAVLQKDQAAQRDECFRAGASELLFMPMPREQFVARLADAVALSYTDAVGSLASVSVSSPAGAARLEDATVTPSGVHAGATLEFRAGDTVRLSWLGGAAAFQAWGLVARSGEDGTQIRFAGMVPQEEARLRDWLRGAAAQGATPPVSLPPSSQAAPASAAPAPAAPARAAPAPAAPAPAAHVAAAPAPAAFAPAAPEHATVPGAAAAPPASAPAPEGRAAPRSGPPPGFADRAPVRPTAPGRPKAPPGAASGSSAASPATATPARPTPAGGNAPAPGDSPAIAPPAPAAAAGAPAQAAEAPADPPTTGTRKGDLFDGAGETASPEAPAAPVGPAWPEPPPAASCKAALEHVLKDKALPPESAPRLAAASKRVAGGLSSTERATVEKAGLDSHFAEALATRIALSAAQSDGQRLFAHSPPAAVDAAAVAGLVARADAAASLLQQEADRAIGKGEVETLQLVTAASAALGRDLFAFKETADRLRGLGAAPRLGAGALDPDVQMPGQPRPPPRAPGAEQPAKTPQVEFKGFESSRDRRMRNLVIGAALLFAGALVYMFFFALPSVKTLPASALENAGTGVVGITLVERTAIVTLKSSFLTANRSGNLNALCETLRSRAIDKALLMMEGNKPAGTVDIKECRAIALPVEYVSQQPPPAPAQGSTPAPAAPSDKASAQPGSAAPAVPAAPPAH